MKIELDLKHLEMYAFIVKVFGYQCSAYQAGIFSFDVASVDYIDFYDVVFNTESDTLYIYDSSYGTSDLDKIYSIIGYARYHDIKVVTEYKNSALNQPTNF